MNERQLKALTLTKRVTLSIFLIGLFVFIGSFLATGSSGEYMMNAGIGVIVAAGFLFGGGLFIALLDRDTEHA